MRRVEPAAGDGAHADTHRAGIAVFTTAPELLAATMATCGRQGRPMVSVQSPPAVGSGVSLHIGNDNHRLGVMLAEQAATRLPASIRCPWSAVITTTRPAFRAS